MAAKKLPDDEVEIARDLGGEPEDPEDPNGALMVEEEKVREVGAVDAESVRANRANQEVLNRMKAKEKGVAFNEPNVLLKYEEITKLHPVNSITILVNRLSSTPATFYITTQPKNAGELYAALAAIHGRREDTTYDILFQDSYKKMRRGTGRITMPSTLDEPLPPQPPQGPPMQQPPPYGFLPPGFGPPAYVAQQPPAPQPAPPAPVPPPVVQVMPTPPQQGTDPIVMMRQMFEIMRAMQPQQAPAAPVPAPAPVPQDPNAAMMAQMLEMMRAMQPQPATPAPVVVQPQPAAQDSMMATMAMMKQMFEMVRSMQPAPVTHAPIEDFPRGPRPAYGPRPQSAYGPRMSERRPWRDEQFEEPSPYGPPPAPPVRQKTAAEEFREAISVVKNVVNMANEFNAPQQQQQQPQAPSNPFDDGDDSPVRVIDAGPAKLVINKEDGSARYWETGWANSDKIFKWVGEQMENLQRGAAEKQRQQQQVQQVQQQRPQLPPGYGYVDEPTPAGYVAVPVDQVPQQYYVQAQHQSGLPPPPVNLPPTIDQQQRQPEPEPEPEQQMVAWGIPGTGQ
jgi:hypothetical protein